MYDKVDFCCLGGEKRKRREVADDGGKIGVDRLEFFGIRLPTDQSFDVNLRVGFAEEARIVPPTKPVTPVRKTLGDWGEVVVAAVGDCILEVTGTRRDWLSESDKGNFQEYYQSSRERSYP